MKKIVLFTTILLTQIGFAQVNKNLGDFNELKVFDRISVELVPSNENRIEITGHRSNEVEIVNKNGELKIRMTFKKLLNGEEVLATLYYKELESIDVSEGSYVSSSRTISQTSIDLVAKEGAQIKLELDVQKVDVKAVTGGIITLSGAATNQDAVIGTGGILNAKSLKTSQTEVEIKAGGEAEVNASDLVDAEVKAGGDIKVYGDPAQMHEKIVLGGTIRKVIE